MQRFVTDYREPDSQQVAYVAAHYQVSPIVAKLLIHRGLDQDLDAFFACDTYHDPFAMHDMAKAVDILSAYMASGEKITVFGDYDVDGVTASAMLYTFLRDQGANADYLLPNRHTDGYGLSIPLIDKLMESGTKLIVTVDCGITSITEALYCKDKGIKLVITDHHQVLPGKLPEADAVVNPLLAGYPFPKLCGAGVAGKLIHALSDQQTFAQYLDFMAVATIADLVPLIGENRVIVKNGLQQLNKQPRPCFAALKSVSGIQGKVEVGHVAFGLAPRINAAGRISSAVEGFKLLTETDYDQAMAKSKNLDLINRIRQKQEEEILQSVFAQIEEQVDLQTDRLILISGKKWNKGVVGIVASKVVEKYHRPVFILSEEDGVCTGSGRSIPGVHLFQLIHPFGQMLMKYGGHEMAAGLSVKAELVNELRSKLNEALLQNCDARLFLPTVHYDMQLPLSSVTIPMIHDLQRMAPMGIGNRTPVFLFENVNLGNAKLIGEKKNHLRLTAVDGKATVDGVAFSMGEAITQISAHQRYDLLATIEGNEWNGAVRPQLMAKAFAPNISMNIDAVVYGNGESYVNSLQSFAKMPPLQLSPSSRLRKMWRGDVYLTRRIRKDVLGTAIYSAIPQAARALLQLLKSEQLLGDVEITYGSPKETSCIVLNPDWSIDRLRHQRLVINDFAPADFVRRVLDHNPNIQIVICNNQDRDLLIQEYIHRLPVNREVLLGAFAALKKLVIQKELEVFTAFCRILKLTPNDARLIMEIFIELGLFEKNKEQLVICQREGKAELSKSELYQTISHLDDGISRELSALIGAVGK